MELGEKVFYKEIVSFLNLTHYTYLFFGKVMELQAVC